MSDRFHRLLSLDIDSLDERELASTLLEARRLQRQLDAVILRLGLRAEHLAAEGRSAPTREFLLGHGEVRGITARRDATRAAIVAQIPALAAALSDGDLGADHLDSMARRLEPLSDHERSDLDIDLVVTEARRLPADTFDAVLKRMVDAVTGDHGLRQSQSVREASEFRHWFDHRTGMGRFSGQLDPERYEAMIGAIDQHMASLASRPGDARTKDALLAIEALFELVCSSGERAWHLPHIVVVTDYETLVGGAHARSISQTSDGRELPPHTISRLACEATIRRVTMSRDRPLGTGRTYRTATNEQWDAIRTLYSSCAWSGCDRPLSWCQMHHILEWEWGGQGELENFVPLCNEHHHAVHEGRWSIKLEPDRSLQIWRPDGEHHTTTDPPSRRIRSPIGDELAA